MLATLMIRLGMRSFMPIITILLIWRSQGIDTMNSPIFVS